MSKVTRPKPGPKSKKQNVIVAQRGILGESSGNSDDSSPEQTLHGQLTLTRSRTARESEFRTPDADNDATDYGLEFTTSHIQNISPRRCSTLKTPLTSQEEPGVSHASISRNQSNKENDTPNVPQTSKPTKNAPKPKVQKTKSAKAQQHTSTSAEKSSEPAQIVKKTRKQAGPEQRERRYWKEVQQLQNRTDNLIPMLPFSRLVRELMYDASTEIRCITPTAMEALQTSAELYLTQRLQDAYMLTLHRGRVTLDVRDMQLIHYLKINL